jgi:hypothetical protein
MDENNQVLECDFAFKCPQQWESLAELDHPDQRFCESCDRKVYFVRSQQQLLLYRRQGHCIAANINSSEFATMYGNHIIVGGVSRTRPDATVIHMFGDQEEVDDLMVVLEQVQRSKEDFQ